MDVLVAVAVAAGLDATEAKVVLDIDSHTAAVQAESAQLRAAGIVAAPLAVLGSGPRRVRMEGAFTLEEWRQAVSSTSFES